MPSVQTPGGHTPDTGAYRVFIRIVNQSTLDQAIKLARTAYDQT
jgi:hypothetical protein